MGCVVKGYDEALEREVIARNVAYLDQPVIVCGEPIKNLTPYLFTVLLVSKCPFYIGGNCTLGSVAQFLWTLHVDYSPCSWWRKRQLIKRVAKLRLEDCIKDISDYFDLTFIDSPIDPKKEKPIASDAAWLVYRFRNAPWNQPEQVTLHMPFRKIYQELRCWQKERGEEVNNRSDKLKGGWLQELNDALRRGDITQEQLDEWNKKQRGLN